MSKYNADSAPAQKTCATLGLIFETRPISAMRRAGVIYVRGAALKPDEINLIRRKCGVAGIIYMPEELR